MKYKNLLAYFLQIHLLIFLISHIILILTNPLSATNIGPQKSINDRTGGITVPRKLGISLNAESNQLILPNWRFSNFSVVQCPHEERTLKTGWNWVSFPKLQRENDDPIELAPLLNTLEPMPQHMLIQHRLNTNGDMIEAYYEGTNGVWSFNDLEELQSTKGYKIDITDENNIAFLLSTPGTRLDPTYPIQIKGDMKENWIGYYQYQQADPFDALNYCIDNLRVIKGQYWSAYYDVIGTNKGIPIYGWIMSKPQPLRYGDMLIVQGINDCELLWNASPKAGGKEIATTSYFNYEEQSDYISVFIELDENNEADEIGAFVGESCVGATAVEENDSIVEIRAYLQGAEGEEMNFISYTGNKSSSAIAQDYYVKDFKTLQFVNRKIRPYDKKPFHFISFKDKSKETQTQWVYHFPNPATNYINIHFNLPDKDVISLEIIDINGKTIDRIELGNYPKGFHQYEYAIPEHWSPGVYFYKFRSGHTAIVNQLIIN